MTRRKEKNGKDSTHHPHCCQAQCSAGEGDNTTAYTRDQRGIPQKVSGTLSNNVLEQQKHPTEPAPLIQAAVLQLSEVKVSTKQKLPCKTKRCALTNGLLNIYFLFFSPNDFSFPGNRK